MAQKPEVAIVTGGSRGIGAATSLLLAKAGYFVVVNYVSNAAAAKAVVTQIEKAGGKAAPALPEATRAWSGSLSTEVAKATACSCRARGAGRVGWWKRSVPSDMFTTLMPCAAPLL